MHEHQKITDLPALTEEQVDDARFRTQDQLWAVIGDLFDKRAETENLNYAELARRIGRTRSQVQRWLTSSHNMTACSAGLLAEGLNADLNVELVPRIQSVNRSVNYSHPCDDAHVFIASCKNFQRANTDDCSMVSAPTGTMANKATVVSGWIYNAH